MKIEERTSRGGGGGATETFAGLGSPVGVVTATGPATYYDRTNPAIPITWIKTTAGTSNSDWVVSASGTPATYPEALAAALRSYGSAPAVAGSIFTVNGSTAPSRCTSRLVVSTIVDENPGGGPITMWAQFRMPASLASNAGVCGMSPIETFLLGSGSDGISFALGVVGGDLNLIMGNSTDHTRYPLGATGLTNQVVDVIVTRSGSTLAAYVNGTAVTLTGVNAGAGCAANAVLGPQGSLPATGILWAHALAPLSSTISNSNAITTGPVTRLVLYNRALSASEAATLPITGVAPADQWGQKRDVIGLNVENGGFEDAGGGGADVFAQWLESPDAGTITRDTSVFAAGSLASCRFSVPSTTGQAQVRKEPFLVVGKRYRVSTAFRHNRPSGNFHPWISGFGEGFIPQASWSPSSVSADTWQNFTAEFVSSSPRLIVRVFPVAPGFAHDQWYDNIVLTRVGAFLDLQFDGTCGGMIADRANQRDAVMFNGAALTQPDATRGFARWIASIPAGEAIGGASGFVIPTDAAIERIVVRNINLGTGQTFSMGTASGSLTNIVNGAPLNGTGDITVIDPPVQTSSTGQLWVAYTGTGSIEVTVTFSKF